MKLFSISIILLILFTGNTYSDNKSDQIEQCEKVLSDLKKIIKSEKSLKYSHVESAVESSFIQFKNKKLGININESIPRNIYGGMQFLYNTDYKNNTPVILISPYMLEIYKTHPSIVLSALVHEMQHAKSYFSDTEYFTSMYKVDLEKYLYELDSVNVEANFIKNYLIPNNFKLTNYEKLLIKSFDDNYLSQFSFIMMGFDMGLTFQMMDINKLNIPYTEKIGKVEKILLELLSKKDITSEDEWNKYKYYIPLRTAVKFFPQIIRSIESKHSMIKDDNNYKISDNNKKLYDLLLKIEKITKGKVDYYIYNDKILNEFEKL